MTKVMCGYVMCKYNKSMTSSVPGECIKDDIELKYVNASTKYEDEKEFLDCKDFVWSNKKVTKNESEKV